MKQNGNWYATVTPDNNKLYNGKEFNREGNINLYDYGARWYDPAIGRWTSVDPLAEAYYSHSSFHYGLNNPIKYVDPNGMSSALYPSYSLSSSFGFKDEFGNIKSEPSMSEIENVNEENTRRSLGEYGVTAMMLGSGVAKGISQVMLNIVNEPPKHVFVQLMFRRTKTKSGGGLTGSVAIGLVVSYDETAGFEYGVYVSGGFGVALGTSGGIGGVELGVGKGDLNSFGGFALAAGGYFPNFSGEATSPGGENYDNISFSAAPLPSKTFSLGGAVYAEPIYTHYLIRSRSSEDIIDYLGGAMPDVMSSHIRGTLILQVDRLREQLLSTPRP